VLFLFQEHAHNFKRWYVSPRRWENSFSNDWTLHYNIHIKICPRWHMIRYTILHSIGILYPSLFKFSISLWTFEDMAWSIQWNVLSSTISIQPLAWPLVSDICFYESGAAVYPTLVRHRYKKMLDQFSNICYLVYTICCRMQQVWNIASSFY
jgi:hypothetical protein